MEEIVFPSIPNLVTVPDYSNRLNTLIQTKITYPYNFIAAKKEFRTLYAEAIKCFLYGLPDAALSLAVRCLERGLKEYFAKNGIKEITYKDRDKKLKKKKAEYARLFEIIRCSENPLKDREILEYLKSLRNYIHEDTLVTDFHALEAIKHGTDALNKLFPFESVNIAVEKCRICGEKHELKAEPDEYYIGNRIQLRCTNRPYPFNFIGELVVNLN
ncbi:MAG: hypothetical protein ACP5MV_03990 [Candidatus Parvarchaeum sp.]